MEEQQSSQFRSQPILPPPQQSPAHSVRSKKPLLLTLLALFLIIVSGVGVYIWQHNKVNNLQKQLNTADASNIKKTSNSREVSTASSNNPYAGWKSHCSTVGYICYKYPSNWSLNIDTASPTQSPSPEADTITSPTGDVNAKLTVDPLHGDGVDATMDVIDINQVGSDLKQISLAELRQDTNAYNAFDVLVLNSLKEGSTNNPFKKGDTYTLNYGGDTFAFVNPEATSNVQDLFQVNGNIKPNSDGTTSEDSFSTLADLENWYNSSEVQTANLILRSATLYSQ